MTKLLAAQRVRMEWGSDSIAVTGQRLTSPQLLGAIAAALDNGLAKRMPAGPGWGTHNALILVGAGDAGDCFTGGEIEYGDWLVTVEE